MSYAHMIRAGRERKRMSQQELADRVGVSLRTVGNWERGETVPVARWAVLADVLDIEDPRNTNGRKPPMNEDRAKVLVEVTAGIIPGQPIQEYTKQWAIGSTEWAKAGNLQLGLLAERNGQAIGYAGLLMMQPEKVNWVRTDWIWL
jgi:transcriptional regulator with XRE-family HTH domain